MVDENNNSCFKRSSTVKWLRACSAVRLLVLDNAPLLLGDTEKKPREATPPHHTFGNCVLLDPPPPLWISIAFRVYVCVCGRGGGGGGVWLYSGTTQFNPLYTDTFCGPLRIHINVVWPHSSQIVSLKNKSITIPLKHHCWNPRQVEYRHLQRKHLHPLLVTHQYIEPENMKFKLHASV